MPRFHMAWHRRSTENPTHRWLRAQVLDLLRPLDRDHVSAEPGRVEPGRANTR